MANPDTLQKILDILRPHCSPFPLQHPKKPLDEAFRLLAGLILESRINPPFFVDPKTVSYALPLDSPKSSSSAVVQDTDDLIR